MGLGELTLFDLTITYMWCFAQFGTICTIHKNVKNTHGGVLLLVVVMVMVVFHVFSIAQMAPNRSKHHRFSYVSEVFLKICFNTDCIYF